MLLSRRKINNRKTTEKQPDYILPNIHGKTKKTTKVKIQCEFCDKYFSYKQSYYRHKKYRCKKYRGSQQYEGNPPNDPYLHGINLPNIHNQNQNINYPSIHNRTYNKVNNYGEEDLDWLKDNFFDVLERTENIKNLSEFVKFGFEQIHCNPNKIENHNISIPNKRDYFDKGLMNIYRNDVWQFEENNKVIIQSIRRFANLMEEQVDEQIAQCIPNNTKENIAIPKNIYNSVDKMMGFIQSFDDNEETHDDTKLIDDVKGGVFIMVDNFKHNYPLLEKKISDKEIETVNENKNGKNERNEETKDIPPDNLDQMPSIHIEHIDEPSNMNIDIEEIGKFIDPE